MLGKELHKVAHNMLEKKQRKDRLEMLGRAVELYKVLYIDSISRLSWDALLLFIHWASCMNKVILATNSTSKPLSTTS